MSDLWTKENQNFPLKLGTKICCFFIHAWPAALNSFSNINGPVTFCFMNISFLNVIGCSLEFKNSFRKYDPTFTKTP